MFVVTSVEAILLAALLTFAAVRKLSHQEHVVQTYARVGVDEDKLNYLAAILLAGAGGLILGLLWALVGVVAAIGLIAYFILAVAAHIRADDAKNLPTPVALAVMAVAALALRLITL